MAEVLLVDDDGSVLLTLAIALRRLGHSITVAGDAFQAMTHLKKARFDFLISDVRMPGISGLELAARARALPASPRVILTSAYPFVEDRHSVSEAFLQKPIDVHLLSEYLNSDRPNGGSSASATPATPLQSPRSPGAAAPDAAAQPRSPESPEAPHTDDARTEPPREESARLSPSPARSIPGFTLRTARA